MSAPLRIVQVGAGDMGRWWLRVLAESADAELVGLVDLDVERARQAAEQNGHPGLAVGADVLAMVAETGAEAVVNVTVPRAHQPVNDAVLAAGLPVLCEKPLAETTAECLQMAAVAELTGQLLMVSQSRRYFPELDALRTQLSGLGTVGAVSCEFYRDPQLDGFRVQMAHPLLVDMAIHHFDLARLLLGADPVSVYCETANPAWSRFAGDAVASAVVAFPGGQRFGYTGSWVAPGRETSWNGEWQISCEGGLATWDGDHAPVSYAADGTALPVTLGTGGDQITGSLAEFVHAVRTGTVPDTEVHRNTLSIAMVEAAVRSAGTGLTVRVADVLEAAHARAVATARDPRVRERLAGWSSVHAALGAPIPV